MLRPSWCIPIPNRERRKTIFSLFFSFLNVVVTFIYYSTQLLVMGLCICTQRVPVQHITAAAADTKSSTFSSHVPSNSESLTCANDQQQQSESPNIDLEELYILDDVIGEGAFAQVYMAYPKYSISNSTNDSDGNKLTINESQSQCVAIKIIDRSKLQTQAAVYHAIVAKWIHWHVLQHRESNTSMTSMCAFINRLERTGHDEQRLWLVYDLACGGDLSMQLQKTNTLSESTVQWYASEIVLAIGFLHEKGVCHGDIAPRNVGLDERGHVLLFDFGLSRVPNTALRTKLLDESKLRSMERDVIEAAHHSEYPTGTPFYRAPEVVLCRRDISPDDFLARDWWSLGVLLFRMLFGETPFHRFFDSYARSGGYAPVYHAIANDSIPELIQDIAGFDFSQPSSSNISDCGVSAECMDFIIQLLSPDASKRLGSLQSGGVAQIQAHPWFKAVDWRTLSASGSESADAAAAAPIAPGFTRMHYPEAPLHHHSGEATTRQSNHHKSNDDSHSHCDSDHYDSDPFADFSS
jgi:serine/threonine protein kinase